MHGQHELLCPHATMAVLGSREIRNLNPGPPVERLKGDRGPGYEAMLCSLQTFF